ncbi:MAG TPA: phytanoyl-CoA dioxygenase family protein [Acidimicrobiales bacterium]|nr:phytanoyl-CoA dioxygenase family protein [Acidimicrobiales bacterium]
MDGAESVGARFDRDGFAVLEGFVPASAGDALRSHADELVAAFDPGDIVSIFTTHEQTRTSDDYFLGSGDQVRFFFEEEAFAADGSLRQEKALSINKIGHAMHDVDPVFDAFSHTPELAAVAAAVGMARPLVLQSMYIFKQPHIGGEVTLHTDHTFLWTDPPSVTGFWFALEDATVENGCLYALPGGHRIPPKRRFRRRAGGDGTEFEELDTTPYPQEGEVPLEVEKGALVVLHGLLPHRSGANRSDRSRHAFTLHAIEASARYPADNWLQRGPDLPRRGFTGPTS